MNAELSRTDEVLNDNNLIKYLGLNPSNPADRAAVAVCQHYGFDPLLKHVVVIPKGGVYITRDGLLNLAHRSGQFDGMTVDQDPELDESGNEWTAKVTVYRKDMRHGFTYPGRYPSGRHNSPEMALKCAEAHALRRAFDVTGLPTLDERQPQSTDRQTVTAADFAPAVTVNTETGEIADEPGDFDVQEQQS